MRKTILAVFALILFAGCSKPTPEPTRAQPEVRADLAKYFDAYKNVYFFATNISSPTPDGQFSSARETITRSILKELGILKQR